MNRKYSIGDFVIVSKTMCREKIGSVVKWKSGFGFCKHRLGQVVGLCARYDGHVQGGNFYNYDDPPYFVPEKTHLFWLVKFGLMNKPVEVSEDNMRLASIDEVENLPTRYPKSTMSEKDKQFLSEDSKTWPRDKKGKWVSGPTIH